MPQGRPQSRTNARRRRVENKKATSKLFNTYINKVNKMATSPYLLKKKNNKVIAIKLSKQANKGKEPNRFECQKILFQTWKILKSFGSREGSKKSKGLRGIWRLGKNVMYIMGYIVSDQVYW
jgi:hypothetical protein